MTAAPTTASRPLPRWDESRSIAELEGRLTRTEKLVLADPPANLDAVKALLNRDAARVDLAPSWCSAVAIIQREAATASELNLADYLKEICDKVAAWNNVDLFVTISDKMPTKLVPAWFLTTLAAKGGDYLIDATLRMPYRLWGVTEKLVAADPALKEHFVKQIKLAFKEEKPSADHFFWLWKAPKSDPDRATFLAKPYVLFKVLRKELKGNYLKSQRELRRLLLSDESFQRALMLNGDETVSRDLINCARRLPLLDADERQALLVRICRLYPYLTVFVADNANRKRLTIVPQTSVRSFQELQKRLQNLIDVEIPANEDDIKTAKGHGDLSENSEFKAAKERQRELGKLRFQLEQQVAELRATDFADVRVSNVVVPGCVVTLKYTEDDHTEAITILGLLDNDPDHNCISYGTPLAKTMLGKEIGETITLPNNKTAVIDALAPLPPELLAALKG
ncbi:MAG: GreA/GreB family elongation factor [Victivallales bacterium]|nr:GreA/GreB family elongation factor [Victivallales bacterium]